MLSLMKALLADESGATAIEYGLIAGLVSIAAVAALTAIGTTLSSIYNVVSTTMDVAAASAAAAISP